MTLSALVFATMFIFSCGESAENAKDASNDAADKTTEVAKDATNDADAVKGETGPEYTSKYVCPMHCEGSGSDNEGKCPACGMAYVLNDATMDGKAPVSPDVQSQDGHDHDDHSGHNH